MVRGAVLDAVAFWERARLGYNGVLAGLLFAFAFATDGWEAIGRGFGMIVILGAIANAFYCLIYPVDLLVQATPAAAVWRRCRWGVWVIGTGFAMLLAAAALFAIAP